MKKLLLFLLCVVLSLSLVLMCSCDDKDKDGEQGNNGGSGDIIDNIPGLDNDGPIELPIIPFE